MPRSVHSRQRARCVLDLSRKLKVPFQAPSQSPAHFVEGGQKMGHVESAHSRVGLKARILFRQANGEVACCLSAIRVCLQLLKKNLPPLRPHLPPTLCTFYS